MNNPNGPKRWERNHNNGWVAIATPSGDGYSCTAYPKMSFQSPDWVSYGISELAGAQKLADEHVPPHECECSPWLVRYSA